MIVDFEDGRVSGACKRGQCLKTEKGWETESPLELPEGMQLC